MLGLLGASRLRGSTAHGPAEGLRMQGTPEFQRAGFRVSSAN